MVLTLSAFTATLAAPRLVFADSFPTAPVLADHSTLTILRGEGAYSAQARSPVVAAVDGQDVLVGDRLISGEGANLLLTFFEGSTFTLTPGSDIVVQRLAGDATSREISLRLNVGTIWARVVSFAGAASNAATFRVETSTAVAVVRGSQIGARVQPDGTFQCWTREGEMSVLTASGQQATLTPGETVVVQPDGQIAVQRPFSPAASMLRFQIEGPVWPVVVHPDGGANGVVVPGVVVSQTFGALVSPPSKDQPLTFEVPVSTEGTYTLVLQGSSVASPEGGTYSGGITGLLTPLYAGTDDPEERLLTGAELLGDIAAGQVVAIAIEVTLDRPGEADAAIASLAVAPPRDAPPPLGPARVVISPVETERLSSGA